MLTNYLEINETVKEELMVALNNGGSGSDLGKRREWTNNLPSKASSSIAKASLHHSSDVIANKGSGHCQCGGVKILKFHCKSRNNSLPSVLWGCTHYRAIEVSA